jgi:peroxiredoxin
MNRHVAAGVVLALGASLALAGCSSDPLAQQYLAGDNKNYIAGDGSVTEIAFNNRGAAINFTGVTETGQKVDSAQFRGHVLVVNFWYAGCAPCRAEAPDLEKVYTQVKPSGTNFLGVNVRDQAATITTFNDKFSITYPSIIDQNGQAQLSFAADVPPNAVPTTLIVDAQGRVAARILGQLRDPSILATLVNDIAAEGTTK